MPKIIEKVREQLIQEVKKQILERGYAKTTIRSVAHACNLGVGTVYNYFPSKDMLIASVVAEDWNLCLEHIKNKTDSTNAEKTLKLIYETLQNFADEHKALFSDPEAVKKFNSIFTERHWILRNQIAQFILPMCQNNETTNNDSQNKVQDPQFLSQFIAEALLTWFMADVPFENLYEIIKKII